MSNIIRLHKSDKEAAKQDLIDLLIDVVNNGASVGFMPPLDETIAAQHWDDVLHLVAFKYSTARDEMIVPLKRSYST